MTEHEKKLIQARHRLEEAQMRDRDKERKARTRRLIQTGAILEKAFPQARTMTTDALSSLPWAIPFGEGEIKVMINQANDILSWYDNMNDPIPSWYK